MKVIILGSGVWTNDQSFPPAVLVDLKDDLILFDCGEGIRFRIAQAGYKHMKIRHIAITEVHPDHFGLIQFYQSVFVRGLYKLKQRMQDLHLYVPKQLHKSWKNIWNYYQPDWKDQNQYWFPKIKWHIMEDGSKRKIGQGRLTSYQTHHGFGKVETLIFRLEYKNKVITYVGDTGPCLGLLRASQDSDIFICEAGSPIGKESHKYGHLNPREAGDFARKADVKHLVLTHYPGINSDKEIIKDVRKSGFKGKVTIAKDLMEFNL